MVTEEIESAQLILAEQHRDYDYLLHIYNRMRAAEGVLLTAVFGIIAYLYHFPDDGRKTTVVQRFFLPDEGYGKVIYFMAAAFFLYAVVKLTLNVFGKNPWETAYESHKDSYTFKHLDTLRYYKKRYDECHEYNLEKYSKRKRELSFLFFCILISATILIVIKTLK